MSSAARKVYMLIDTPVSWARPLFVGFRKITPETQALFKKYTDEVEEARKAGYYHQTLSKREIEQWLFFPPCGARFEVVEVTLPEIDKKTGDYKLF